MHIIDLHCDTISKIYQDKQINLRQNDLDVDLLRLKKNKVFVQCFAVFLPYPQENMFQRCLDMIDCYQQQISANSDLIRCARTYEDIKRNRKRHKISAILTIEEGNVIEGNLDNIAILANLGVKIMSLTWNRFNQIGYPNTDKIDDKGLTPFGIEVVKKMNEHHIIIDVSHLGDQGVRDVLSYSTKPILATHSNVRSICHHLRNLSDELILKIKKNGGVIGCNFYPKFISDENASISEFIEHLLYLKKMECLDIIGIGSDFDGIEIHTSQLEGVQCYPNLILALQQANFTHQEIENICYKNILRFFKKNLF